MNFNVAKPMQGASGAARFYEVDEQLDLDDGSDAPRLGGSVRLLRTDRGVWVSARLDSESATISQDNVLDMTEVIEQYIALSLPMKLVCRPDCKGICLVCGTDLNTSSCDCDRRPVDGRWAPLADAASLVHKN
jgi:hypothetical protein